MQNITVEALSVAAFATILHDMDHETCAVVTATENGEPWAVVDVSPMTDSQRSAFPNYACGGRGDTRKRGQSGVMFGGPGAQPNALAVVIDRARRMHAA